MPVYRTTKKSKQNKPRYTINGRMIPAQYVPTDIVKILETQTEYEDNEKRCLICLKLNPTHTRFAELQVVDLCEDDYYNKRMGEVIQALRKLKEYTDVPKKRTQEKVQEAPENITTDAQDGVLGVSTKTEADTAPTPA